MDYHLLASAATTIRHPVTTTQARNNMRVTSQLLLVAALAATPNVVAGAQVWDNGVPNNANGYSINNIYGTANDFTLSSTTALGAFNWWALTGERAPTVTASYRIDLASNGTGGYPGAVFKSFIFGSATGTITGYGCCGLAAYAFSADLGGYSLGAGTYWANILNYSDGTVNSYWATSSGGTSPSGAPQRLGNSADAYGEGAFNISASGAVVATPEPASVALLATGLIGLAGMARSRKRI
ncbi:hypothetical protein BH09GEM1_BH09GEM1_30690 [soil metagenome]